MSEETIQKGKKNIVAIGALLWEKDLVTGLNGNISVRDEGEKVLLTATKTCLGLLQEKDILLMDLNGNVLEDGKVSSEKLLHTEIYKNFPDVKAILHTHTTFTNAYFLHQDKLTPQIFETKLYLGEVSAIEQLTPSVTDVAPVIESLRTNNLVVLRNHGVLAMGEDLFECFLLIQCLEESVKVNAISRLYTESQSHRVTGSQGHKVTESQSHKVTKSQGHKVTKKKKTYELFSREQIDRIVEVVNEDAQLGEMGSKTGMTMDLAVKLDETGEVYSFSFQDGKIEKVGQDADAEFLISAPAAVWRSVFKRELDPFVATTQKKMNLRGDFARISKWYAPCSRIFELWGEVPVE